MSDKIVKTGSLIQKSSSLSALRSQVNIAKSNPVPDGAEESLVLVLDVSGSMSESASAVGAYSGQEGSKLQALIQACHALISDCHRGRTQMAAVAFSDGGQVIADMTTDLISVDQKVAKIFVVAGTNIGAGLVEAEKILDQCQTKIRRVILMTDGVDGYPTVTLERAGIIGAKGIVIDCVAFGMSSDRSLLGQISGCSSGLVKEANSAGELVKAFKQLEAGARGLLTKGG